ncbi:sensor histidine kinase [Clostridium oryzae]|nr:HAMP domain-containing sensor histidine kinase [Clostridium oryzae]
MIDVLLIVMVVVSAISIVLTVYVFKVKKKLSNMLIILEDIEKGNRNRKILSNDKDDMAKICYKINGIVSRDNEEILKLQESDKAYRQLLTSISHDVRTPLASLIGYLDAVHSKIVEGEEKEEYIGIARSKSYKLKELVDILFEWFKINSNEKIFDFELTDINELTRGIIAGWIPAFEEKKVAFNINIPDTECKVSLDISSYSRIINNLMQNSMTHSECETIEVEIKSGEKEVEINISDDGRGIDKKDIPYVFDRLYRADKSRSGRGNGLGLSIAKELISAHHGSIAVESVPNKRTTFKIKLPVKETL